MAERRMFAKTIIDSDCFLEMPVTARLLYYDLAMRADDDGFVNSPKKIMRIIGAAEDDLRILITRQFVIPFDSGIVVIKHWRVHNYIQSDRYKETVYKDEKGQLRLENRIYYPADGPCDNDVSILDTQNRLGKDSIGKDSIENNSILNPLLSSRCSSNTHSIDTIQSESSGSSYSDLTPCYTPTNQDIQLIINTWNSQNCTKNIQSIPVMSRRWNDTLLCIRNNLEAFLQAIREIDNQAYFTKRFRDRKQPAIYNTFVEPNNYLKYLEGNYREEYRKEKKHGSIWDDPIVTDDRSELSDI